jgi:RNA polymerase subunit RPABC4/transcription elongation factor Spt4
MFCKNCGTQLSDDSKFCSNCGYKTEDANSNESIESIEIDNSQIKSESETTNPSSSNRLKELYNKISDKLFLGGFVSAAFGTILFVGIILVSLMGWGKVYLYGGYDFTSVLTTISLIFMLLGFVVLSIVSIINLKLKSINRLTKKVFISLTIVLLVLCVAFSTWGVIDYANEQDNGSSYSDGSYSGNYNDYYSSGIDKSIGLSLKVDSIKTSGSYTYVYCTVTNVSSKYVATRYRYVKVKAQFKNYSGSIVDTDWTYAVDSTWLEPGESKTFYYMVQNTNIKSATLSFVD